MKKSILVNQFFQMKERSGIDIAANTDINYGNAIEKLKRKYGIKEFTEYPNYKDIDEEKIEVFKIDGEFYGKSVNSDDYWNLDAHTFEKEVPVYDRKYYDEDDYEEYPTGETTFEDVTEYQINSTLTDENILEFLKAYEYLESEGRALRNAKSKAEKMVASEEFEKAKALIKVEILDSEYRTAADFADEVEDENEEITDEEAKFKIKVSAGQTPLFTGTVYPTVYFNGSSETTYYSPATMYNRYGDPGDPEESAGTVSVIYQGVDDYFYMEDEFGEEITAKDFADKVPEGKFRDLYEKYADKVILDTIDSLIRKAGDYEGEW